VKLYGARLLVVDYLQLIAGPGETQEAQVAAISGALKTTAARLGIPILVPAQLNRDFDRRESGVPRLSDLRSSGRIAQDATKVMLLWRERSQGNCEVGRPAPSGPVNLLVAKSRNGPTGNVKLYWEAETTTFFPAEKGRHRT
jgi:replicative DNA helicase